MRRVAVKPQGKQTQEVASTSSATQVYEESSSTASAENTENVVTLDNNTYQQLQTVQTVHGYPHIPANATTAVMYRGRPTGAYVQQMDFGSSSHN